MQSEEDHDYIFKVVLVGDARVGKSNLFNRFNNNKFDQDSQPTIGVEFATQYIGLKDNKIKLQLWDTAGQERYRAITQAYYRGAFGALLVYDITQQESFDNLQNWLKELREYAGQEIEVVVVGNKSDLNVNQRVKTEFGENFAKQNAFQFIEVSALNGQNIEVLFSQLTERIYNKLQERQQAEQVEKVE